MDAASAPMLPRAAMMLAFGSLASLAGWHYLRAVRQATPHDWRPLLIGAVVIHVVAALALPLTSNDLFSNLAYGRVALQGGNPYLVGPSSLPADDPFSVLVGARWVHTPIVYGPLITLLDSVVVRTGGVIPSLIAYKALLLGCSLGVVGFAWLVCRGRRDPNDAVATFVLVSWSPVLVWEISAQAHNDGLPVLALAAGIWTGLRERRLLTTLFFAIAVFAKFAAAPVLALHLALLLRRSPGRALLLGIIAAGVGVLLFAPYWQGFATLRGPLLAAGGAPGRTARSLVDLACLVAGQVGATPEITTYRVLSLAGFPLLAALGVRALFRVRCFEDVVHHSLLVLLAWNLVTPWFQPWYVTWLLPLVLLERDPRLRWTVAVYSALSTAQYILPIDPLTNVAIDAVVFWMLFARRRAWERRWGARGGTDPEGNVCQILRLGG